jgi:membrane associated rhomboid family serine protease
VILLLPLGPGERSPRAPRLTSALVGLNVLVFLFTARPETQKSAEAEAELLRVAEWSLRVAGRDAPALESRVAAAGSPLHFLDQDATWQSEVRSPELRERLLACLADYRQIKASHPFYRYGLVPAELRATRLLTHQFLHADFPHLLFNMIFLWTAGGVLELSLGPLLFACAYLLGGVAAGLAHVALHAASPDPVIGASGAVAAAMGMLLALHARRPIRLALVAMLAVAPRITFLAWPAWVFLGLWLLEQLYFASFGATTLGVAFGAHLGGFAFGLVAAAALKALGWTGDEADED